MNAPAQNGNGVYFLNCCTNLNTAYYKFTGAGVSSVFNVTQGQISFYLKSRSSTTPSARLACREPCSTYGTMTHPITFSTS